MGRAQVEIACWRDVWGGCPNLSKKKLETGTEMFCSVRFPSTVKSRGRRNIYGKCWMGWQVENARWLGSSIGLYYLTERELFCSEDTDRERERERDREKTSQQYHRLNKRRRRPTISDCWYQLRRHLETTCSQKHS